MKKAPDPRSIKVMSQIDQLEMHVREFVDAMDADPDRELIATVALSLSRAASGEMALAEMCERMGPTASCYIAKAALVTIARQLAAVRGDVEL